MKIQNINNISPVYKNNKTCHVSTSNKVQISDVFQKSNVSFRGNDPIDDFFNSFLLRNIFADELTHMLDKTLELLSMDDEALEEEFMKMFLDEQVQREQDVSMYIDVLSDKSIRRMLLGRRKDKLDEMNRIVFADAGLSADVEYLNDLLYSSGIKSMLGLDSFIRVYNQSPQTKKAFRDLGIEAIKIYGNLKTKEDLSKFPELLLHIFIQEELNDEPNYERLNTTVEFLKQIGLTNFDDFSSRYSYLADDFNGFSSVQDQVDAIEYLQETYDSKIDLLTQIKNGSATLKNTDSKKIYANIHEFVDVLYEKNKQNGLSPLESIIEIASQAENIKQISLKNIGDFCNGLETPEDKIEFFKFLRDCDVSISEFNVIAGKSPISDRNIIDALVYRNEISAEIAKMKEINLATAKESYKKFSSEFCIAYENGEMQTLLQVMDDYSIKNADSMLSFYNRVTGKNVRSITSSEFLEFIELFKYSNSKNVFASAKTLRVLPIEILKTEKESFLVYEKEIEKFLQEDETGYFVGKKAFDIYSEYKDLLPENPEETLGILQNIRDFNIANSDEYKQKAALIEPFSKYFSSKHDLVKFVSQAGILLDSSNEDNQHIRNCSIILDSLYDRWNDEKSNERISQLIESGFLSKSKMSLTQLIESLKNKQDLKAFLEMVADKKVPSLSALGRFMSDYDSTDGRVDNLFHHLYSMPDGVDFVSYIKVLQHLHNGLESLNLPSGINNDNIMGINVPRLINFPVITQLDAGKILNDLYPSENGGNFISVLPNAMVDKIHFYSRFKIAEEIVNRVSASDESYQNLTKKLDIDREIVLDEKYSHYSLVSAVAKKIPNEFVSFVNSEEWLKFDENLEKIPNLSLHSRMRLIDRFGFQDDDLYGEKTKQNLRDVLKSVYTKTPYETRGTDYTKRIIVDTVFENSEIETVFSKNGEMITIVPRHSEV